jgi:hypothetical protein
MMEQRQATAHEQNLRWQPRPSHDVLPATFTTSLPSTLPPYAYINSTHVNTAPFPALTPENSSPSKGASVHHLSIPDTPPLCGTAIAFNHDGTGIAVARQTGASTAPQTTVPPTTTDVALTTTQPTAHSKPHSKLPSKLHGVGLDQLEQPLQRLQRVLLWFIVLSFLLCLFAPHANAQLPYEEMSLLPRQSTPSVPPTVADSITLDTIRQHGHCQQQVCWQVSPVLCPSNDADSSCQLQLSVRWTSSAPISPCLHLDQRQLYCWASGVFGQSQHQLRLSQHANVTLSDVNGILLEQQISVLQRQPKQRPRLMMPWSIF